MALHVVKLTIPVAAAGVNGSATAEQKLADGTITGVEIDFQGTLSLDKAGVQLAERGARFVPNLLSSEPYVWHRGYQIHWNEEYEVHDEPWVVTVIGTNADTVNAQIVEVRITTARITPRHLQEFTANALKELALAHGNLAQRLEKLFK